MKKAKIVCVLEDTTMRKLLVKLLEEHVAKHDLTDIDLGE